MQQWLGGSYVVFTGGAVGYNILKHKLGRQSSAAEST